MMKLSIALFGLLLLAPPPLQAVGQDSETHIFEFDYDSQIEAPVLRLPPDAAAAPPERGEAAPPPKPAETVETEEAPPSLDALFSPYLAEETEKAADQAEAPEKIEIQITEKPAQETAAIKAEKAKAPPSPAPLKKPAAETRQIKAESGPPPKATARKSEAPFISDPRRRFWLLAGRTWNLAQGGFSRAPAEPVIDLTKFPPAAPLSQARAEVIDLRNFPKLP